MAHDQQARTQSESSSTAPKKGRRRSIRQIVDKLEKVILLDGLTELPNRRFIERDLRSRLEELKRYKREFGVLFIDVDGFKRINEALGRKAGNKALVMIAGALTKSTRPFDMVGRAGGEKFLATIVNVDEKSLHKVAEKLRKAVETLEISSSPETVRVSVSIGGTLAQPGDTKTSIITRAYRFMRESKLRGRNCVTVGAKPEKK